MKLYELTKSKSKVSLQVGAPGWWVGGGSVSRVPNAGTEHGGPRLLSCGGAADTLPYHHFDWSGTLLHSFLRLEHHSDIGFFFFEGGGEGSVREW